MRLKPLVAAVAVGISALAAAPAAHAGWITGQGTLPVGRSDAVCRNGMDFQLATYQRPRLKLFQPDPVTFYDFNVSADASNGFVTAHNTARIQVGEGTYTYAAWIRTDGVTGTGAHIDPLFFGLLVALILAPAGLRAQWRTELTARLGLEATLADSRWLKSASADRPAHVNPWSMPGIYVASHDLVKRPEILRALEDVTWDVVVIDEAHVATSGTDRRAALPVGQAPERGPRPAECHAASSRAGASNRTGPQTPRFDVRMNSTISRAASLSPSSASIRRQAPGMVLPSR